MYKRGAKIHTSSKFTNMFKWVIAFQLFLLIVVIEGCSHTFDHIPARIKVHGWPRHHEVILHGCVTPKEMLAQVEDIEIKHRNVTILDAGSFQNLLELRHLHLEHSQIEHIEPDAFYNLPNLHTLSLKGNRLREITEGVFNHLPIRKLYLTANRIERIAPNAFDNMPNLEVLYLDHNLIKEWNPQWFKHSTNLRTFYINDNHLEVIRDGVVQHFARNLRKIAAFNNQIREVQSNAFANIDRIDSLLLHNNRISSFEVSHPIEINVLVLQHNNLRCLPQSFIDNVRIRHRLHLVNNPLEERCLELLRRKAMSERFVLAFNRFLGEEDTPESD